MSAQLEIKNLSLSIPTGHVIQGRKQVLDNISFDVPTGVATAYLGINGAGKTSTFRILCGLCKADSGEIYFQDQLLAPGECPSNFGFMPEHPYFYKNLTPRELLSSLGKLSKITGTSLDKSIQEWAEKLQFCEVLNQKMSTCSKGQIQRVGLAQALIHQPAFILLDEPLSGLDPLGRELVRNVIQAEIRRGATVLFSSHILSDAEAMCDRVIVLHKGKVVYEGYMRDLLSSQNGWVIQALWINGSPPTIKGTRIETGLNGNLQIRGQTEQQRDEIIRLILQSDKNRLISVEPEQRSLEQAFIELLGKGNS